MHLLCQATVCNAVVISSWNHAWYRFYWMGCRVSLSHYTKLPYVNVVHTNFFGVFVSEHVVIKIKFRQIGFFISCFESSWMSLLKIDKLRWRDQISWLVLECACVNLKMYLVKRKFGEGSGCGLTLPLFLDKNWRRRNRWVGWMSNNKIIIKYYNTEKKSSKFILKYI